MRIAPLLAALALSLVGACGGADAPADTPADTTAPAAEPAETARPDAEQPAEAAPASITVVVQNLSKGQSGPGVKPVLVTATSGTNQITVHLERFSHYCSPAPSFTAAVEGDKLVVTVAKPASAVSRCVSPHDLDAVVSLPGRNNVRTVALVDISGKELGTATVTSGK